MSEFGQYVKIQQIASYLPERILSNSDLIKIDQAWNVEKISSKTGIYNRHIAGQDETAADLAVQAGKSLLAREEVNADEIDFLILATQSPDYILPTTACIIQDRLALPTSCGALDFNLGCSGYIYGLGLAQGLIASGQAKHVILLTADTYSKYLDPKDKSTRSIFGDGASATLLSVAKEPGLGKPVYGTDGSSYEYLIMRAGGCRHGRRDDASTEEMNSDQYLQMNGPDLFNFTISNVPGLVTQVLEKNQLELDQIDLFIFHQANEYMLKFLRKMCQIPEDKFYTHLADCGNTVSTSIPLALGQAIDEQRIQPGMRVMLIGFGVGLSWGGTVIHF